MTSLIVNADQTTSWGTSTDKFPATVTELPGGIYHIVSASTVEEEDRVDVYTDGTMAHVVHDESSYDNYVMDKNASGASATAFAETEDETKFFGGVELSNGHWKYFASINGVYHFGVTLALQAGNNISNGGAIFDVTIGGAKSTFRVTSAAANVGAFATVEAFDLTVTTFTGDNGDLTIGKTASGELVFAKLDGTELVGAILDGDVLTVKDADTTETRKTDEGVFVTSSTITYTLASIARTYTVGAGTMETPLFHELTGNSGTYNTQVGADGHLWATFRSPIGGVLHITETIRVPEGSSSGDDTYITIFKASATTNYAAYSGATNGVVLNEDDGYTAIDSTLDIEPNVTYVIKLGSYKDYAKDYTYTGSLMAGETEEMEWEFTPNTLETYTGSLGTLNIEKKTNTIKNITLDGEPVVGYTLTGNTLTIVTKTPDLLDPSDISVTTKTTTLTLDATTGTYEADINSTVDHPFTTLTESSTGLTEAVGSDGSLWATFTPSRNGIINLEETAQCASYTYLIVYQTEYTDAAGVTHTATVDDLKGTSTSNPFYLTYVYVSSYTTDPAIHDLVVLAGKTYVIRACASSVTSENIFYSGYTLTSGVEGFTFSFTAYDVESYTGAEGDLKLFSQDGSFCNASINGVGIASADYDEDAGTLTILGAPTFDFTTDPANPTKTSTDTVYTLDAANHTYVKTTTTNTVSIFKTLTDGMTYTGVAGPDGNIWGKFTAPNDGFIDVVEPAYAGVDSQISIYEEAPAMSNYGAGKTKGTYLKEYADGQVSSGNEKIMNFAVTAGTTYIIKYGGYSDNSKFPGGTSTSSNAGKTFSIKFNYRATVTRTFTGDEGDIVLKTNGSTIAALSINGATKTASNYVYNAEEDTLSSIGTSAFDLTTNPLDPVETRTDKKYTLDADALTYTVEDTVITNHLFSEIEAGVAFNGTTGRDGSYYATYTATESGVIQIKDTALANTSDYIIVYEALSNTTAADYKGTYKSASTNKNSFVGYTSISSANGVTSKFEVEAGHTYVIKVCSSSTASYAPGQVAAAAYQNKAGSILLSFTPYVTVTAAGDDGELVVTTLNGAKKSITLGGTELEGATLSADGKTITVKAAPYIDYAGEEPMSVSVTTTYTLSEDGTTYEIETTRDAQPLVIHADATGTFTTITPGNGLGVLIFVAPADGTYTITALMDGVDSRLGVYTDDTFTTLVSGTSAVDGVTGYARAESVTFTATAGTTYYVKTGYWLTSSSDGFSNPLTKEDSTYAGKTVTFTITAGGSSTGGGSSSGGGYYDDDDDYWDDYDWWD